MAEQDESFRRREQQNLRACGVIFVQAQAEELERGRRRAAFCDRASRLHGTKSLLHEAWSKTIWREATDAPRGELNLAEAASRARRCSLYRTDVHRNGAEILRIAESVRG